MNIDLILGDCIDAMKAMSGDIKGHKRGDWRKLVAMMLENSLFMQIGGNDEIR